MRIAIAICCLLLTAGGCDSNTTAPIDKGPGLVDTVGDGTAGSEAKNCVEISRKAELPPLDMLIALDTSYSMDFSQKWDSVKAAMKQFATDPRFANLGVGLQYFPLRAQCNVDAYATPAVPIGPLSAVSTQILASLDAQQMSGGTPMVPMLKGTLNYCRDWAQQNPARKVVVVLATDGIPDNTCLAGALPNTLPNVVSVAAEGAASKPAVATFVIGVGKELTSLDLIAQAGGTSAAFLVDPTKDLQQAFLTALNDIRRDLACDYQIPPPPPGEVTIDYTKVNVRYTRDGAVDTLVNVPDKASCASAGNRGWYYDVTPQPTAKPTKIILCDQTCKRVQQSDTGQVDVVLGCKTIPA
jgi:hypothetical protein